jgi:hypothetical protein
MDAASASLLDLRREFPKAWLCISDRDGSSVLPAALLKFGLLKFGQRWRSEAAAVDDPAAVLLRLLREADAAAATHTRARPSASWRALRSALVRGGDDGAERRSRMDLTLDVLRVTDVAAVRPWRTRWAGVWRSDDDDVCRGDGDFIGALRRGESALLTVAVRCDADAVAAAVLHIQGGAAAAGVANVRCQPLVSLPHVAVLEVATERREQSVDESVPVAVDVDVDVAGDEGVARQRGPHSDADTCPAVTVRQWQLSPLTAAALADPAAIDAMRVFTVEECRRAVSLAALVSHRSGGVDNTGNVRVWAAEHVLAYLCVVRAEELRGRVVVELGAGMTGLCRLCVFASPPIHASLSRRGHLSAVLCPSLEYLRMRLVD